MVPAENDLLCEGCGYTLNGLPDDGRCPELTDAVDLAVGVYRLRFETGAWFARSGTRTFYPVVEITFEVVDASSHHHVPLLLSPFAYSTYRGS